MRLSDFVQAILAKAASLGSELRRQSEFRCGDCNRVDRCGLLPSDKCIEKAAQIERGWRRHGTLARWPVM
jgi:hypothetical protein